MARWIRHDRDSGPVLRAAAEWRDRCLLSDRSVFADDGCWSLPRLRKLKYFVFDNPIEGKETFYEKLKRQLRSAPPVIHKLAGEMLWLMFLFPSEGTIRGNTKRDRIKRVWERSGSQLKMSDWRLTKALDEGIGGVGQGFLQHLWPEFGLLVDLSIGFKELNAVKQNKLLNDPYGFANWLDSRVQTGHPQLRHTILYLLFPDTFERISSTTHKNYIVAAFNDLTTEVYVTNKDSHAVAVDKKLEVIRQQFEKNLGTGTFDFYEERSVEREWWKQKYQKTNEAIDGSKSQSADAVHEEGGWHLVVRTEFPRNRKARQECVRIHGAKCCVCGLDFHKRYGSRGKGYIHVHHLNPISAKKESYKVNPRTDLRPVCPNCHAMIHIEEPMLEIEELKSILRKMRKA